MSTSAQIFDIIVIDPLRRNQRKHLAKGYTVLAPSAEAASKYVRERFDLGEEHLIQVAGQKEYDGVTPLLVHNVRVYSYSKEYVARLRGETLPEKKARLKSAFRATRLGNVQKDVLASVKEHGGYPGGWMWDTPSHTVRVLDSLVKRGLVDLKAGNYKLNEAGNALLEELKNKVPPPADAET